ncbi:MAG: glycosyltransferase [Candidatus Auribacterota bacterium]|jgi:glycosyltransferase involved in cell wall biosynthesis|nr:glycosyltransferase [Candidatus Auribacterota bacterium]
MPLVSIIIPTYNRPKFIGRALESVSKQTFTDFEAIIINDAGADVRHIVDRFDDPRFVYITTGSRTGPGVRNAGVLVSKGKYIAYLDDDDLYYPHHLQTVVDAIEKHSADFVYSGCVTVYENDDCTEVRKTPRIYSPYHRSLIRRHSFMPTCSILHHRKLFEQAGYFDESISFGEDWDMWFRFSGYTTFIHIDEYTCEYHKRLNKGTNINSLQETRKNNMSLGKTRLKKYGIIDDPRSHYNSQVPKFTLEQLISYIADKQIYIYGAGSYFKQIYPYIKQHILGVFDAKYKGSDGQYDGIPCMPLEKLYSVDKPILSTVVGQIPDVLVTVSKYTSRVDNFIFLDDFFDRSESIYSEIK